TTGKAHGRAFAELLPATHISARAAGGVTRPVHCGGRRNSMAALRRRASRAARDVAGDDGGEFRGALADAAFEGVLAGAAPVLGRGVDGSGHRVGAQVTEG